MSDSIRDFVVSYAFNVDDASRQRAESSTKAAEDRITAANAAALAKRIAQENRAQAERIAAAVKAGTELNQADRRFVAEQEKRRLDAITAERTKAEEAGKRNSEHLEKGYKQAQAQAYRLTSLAIKTVAAFDLAKLVDNFTVGAFSKLDLAARQFEKLNYVAQNTGGSVKGINAVVYALSQLGTSAEDAESSFQNFGSNLQKYKAFEDILKSMGVTTRDMNGQLRDSSQLFQEYLTRLASMPRAQREAVASGWGISEGTVQAGSRPQFGAYVSQAAADQMSIGSNGNATAQSGLAFSQAMRHVNNLIDQVKTSIADVLFRTVTPQLDAVADWLRNNGKTVSDVISALATGAEKLGASFVHAIAGNDSVKDALSVLSKGLIQFGDYIGSDDFKKTIKGFVSDIVTLARSIRWALEKIGILTGSASSPGDDKKQSDLAAFDPSTDPATHGEGIWNRGFHGRTLRGAYNDDANKDRVQGKVGAFRAAGAQQQANAFAIADELRKAGVPDEGIAASLGSAQTESSLDPAVPENEYNHGHHGLWQWDSTRWPKIVAWIKSQGGDPMDARWQTKAHIAEGRAQPGDAIYDGPQTTEGFHKLETSKGDLGRAVEGMRGIERFGSGEEGGRAANAKQWLGHLPTSGGGSGADSTGSGDVVDRAQGMVGLREGQAAKALGHIMHAGEWCADFVNGTIEANGGKGSGSAMAKSFMNWGKAVGIGEVKRGDVAVLNGGGHVGFFTGERRQDGRLGVVAGNTRDGQGGHDVEHYFVTPGSVAGARRGAPPVKVEVTDASAAKVGKGFASSFPAGTVPRSANPLADLKKDHFDAFLKTHADEAKKFGVSPAARMSMSSAVRHGDKSIVHNPTFNIQTSDAKAGLSAAHMVADRGNRDLIRNMQGMES